MNISKIVDFHRNVKRRSCNCTNFAINLLLHENYHYCMFWEAYLAHMREQLWNLSSKITKLRGEYLKNRGFSPTNVKRRSRNCPNFAITFLLHENYHYDAFCEAYLTHMRGKLWNLSSKTTKLRAQYLKSRGFSPQSVKILR